jgi:mono/diheme cytochrome c family protein
MKKLRWSILMGNALPVRLQARVLLGVFATVGLFLVAGCDHLHQDMGNQPKNLPLSPSDFFADGRSERMPVENTVSREALDNDDLMVTRDSNNFPVPVSQALLDRGEERYRIFCSPCHGIQGDGNGMVVMRGMKRPPSYHEDRLRQAPNGHFYDVMTNGFGQMYSYSAQIPPRDRWAIVAYVRALQLSRNARVADLPADVRDKLNSGGTTR